MESRIYYRAQMSSTKQELFQLAYNDASAMFDKLADMQYDQEFIKKYRILDLLKKLHEVRGIIDKMDEDIKTELNSLIAPLAHINAPGA